MSQIKADEILNLEGVVCPNNFVKTKLKLEGMQEGQVLEVILDDGEPIKNVPRAVKEEGHEIIAVEKLDNKWRLLIKKV
jgi:tRNA 2-thiouridine synthesizing protein A